MYKKSSRKYSNFSSSIALHGRLLFIRRRWVRGTERPSFRVLSQHINRTVTVTVILLTKLTQNPSSTAGEKTEAKGTAFSKLTC